MNTTTCIDCFGLISVRVDVCPHCGGPSYARTPEQHESAEESPIAGPSTLAALRLHQICLTLLPFNVVALWMAGLFKPDLMLLLLAGHVAISIGYFMGHVRLFSDQGSRAPILALMCCVTSGVFALWMAVQFLVFFSETGMTTTQWKVFHAFGVTACFMMLLFDGLFKRVLALEWRSEGLWKSAGQFVLFSSLWFVAIAGMSLIDLAGLITFDTNSGTFTSSGTVFWFFGFLLFTLALVSGVRQLYLNHLWVRTALILVASEQDEKDPGATTPEAPPAPALFFA